MVTFAEGLRSGLRNAYCSQVSNSPTWFANLRRVLVSGDLRDRADFLNQWVCGDPPGGPSPADPPFTGGQCNKRYEVTFQIGTSSSCADGNRVTTTQGGQLWGPIRGAFRGPSTCPEGGQDKGPAFILANSQFGGPDLGTTVEAFAAGSVFDISIVSVEVIDGGASGNLNDDCGDPPLDLPPSGPVNVTTNINYEGDDGTEFNLTVPTIFAPIYVAFDGTLRIPIRIGELNFNGEININNDFEVTPDFGSERGPGDTDGNEEPFPPDPNDPIDPDDLDSPATIVGVEVFSQPAPGVEASSILFQGGPNIFAPRLGSVKFAIRTPTSLVWTPDQDIKNRETYIPCPAPQGAVAVRASPAPGVTLRWNAIRAKPLLES